MKHPRTAALTGGIASGKSTVSAMLRECGAAIIDADVLARQVVEPHRPAWDEAVAAFGREVLAPDETLDRKRLGALIFQCAEKRRVLEQIIHPRVIAEIDHQETAVRELTPDAVVVVDVPLLIEAQMHLAYRTVIVVFVPLVLQLRRLLARDTLSEHEARQRLNAQMPLADKCAYATHIIDNSGSLDATRRRVVRLYQELAG
jgi:dephospho-CoA kinase